MKQFLHAVLTVALVLVAATSAPSSPPAASVFPNLQNDPLFDQETYQALQWPISLAVKGGSIYELLENLGQQTGCTIRVHHGLVLIMPQATLPPHNSQPEVP
jgi:hypothetical protein